MSRRERMVMVEPRGTGMVLITLRAADEVRAPQFSEADGAIDAEMLAIARTIIERADREIRSEQVPRPLPGGVTGADRGQDEGFADQAARRSHARTRNRFDGSLEAQPRAGNAGCQSRHT